jgi:hypothetical protein
VTAIEWFALAVLGAAAVGSGVGLITFRCSASSDRSRSISAEKNRTTVRRVLELGAKVRAAREAGPAQPVTRDAKSRAANDHD